MPRVVKGPDGVVRSFSDDFTDEQIASVLAGSAPEAEKPKPYKSESGFRGIEAAMDAVRAIPDVARNLFNSDTRAATLGGAKEGAKAAVRDFAGHGKEELLGAKDVAVATKDMALHPIDTAKALGGMAVDAGKAAPGFVRDVAVGSSDERKAALRKLAEDVTGVTGDQAESSTMRTIGTVLGGVALAKGTGTATKQLKRVNGARTAKAAAAEAAKVAERAEMQRVANGLAGHPPDEVVARGLGTPKPAVDPEVARVARGLAGDVPDEVVARGMAEGPKPVPGSRVVNPNDEILKDLRETIDAAKQDARYPGPAEGATVSNTPPPANLAQPRVSYPRVPKLVAGKKVPPKTAPEAPKPAPDAPAAVPEPPAGPSSPPQAAPAMRAPGISTVSKDGQKVVVRPKPGIAGGLRSLHGAEKAAKILGVTKDDVKRAAPGPSRRPLAVEMAEDDANYRRRIMDERGSVDPKTLLKVAAPVAGAVAAGAAAEEGEGLQDALVGALMGAGVANPGAVKRGAGKAYRSVYKPARMIGMLSGAALPKSILGNIGAHLNAAVDHGSMAPIKQLAKPGAILRDVKDGWKAQANPSGHVAVADGSFLSKFNVPGRLMGAMDHASEKSLMRGGLTKSEAQRQLLTSPGAVTGKLGRALESPLGQHLVPFQRVPFNSVAEGIEAGMELAPGSKATRLQKNATRGAIGAGAVAGTQTDDPVTLALISALLGRRALPFVGGATAALTATEGPSKARFLAERMGTGIPDISIGDIANPMRPITNPAIINWLKYLKGEK